MIFILLLLFEKFEKDSSQKNRTLLDMQAVDCLVALKYLESVGI